MPEKDQKTKEYLANQVSNGLRDIMNGDKVDIEQHIDFNKSGMDKLHKMTEKHALVKDKQNFTLKQLMVDLILVLVKYCFTFRKFGS